MGINPLLLEEYNKGVERAVQAYYNEHSEQALRERADRKREKNTRNQQAYRTRVRLKRDGAA